MPRPRAHDNGNSAIADLLRALASVEAAPPLRAKYLEAAVAIAALGRPIAALLRPDGSLEPVAGVSPAAARVVVEIVTTGSSPTVERALARSRPPARSGRTPTARDTFLDDAAVAAALADPTLAGPSLADYRGDLQMHSTYSDGSQPLEAIVATGLARGYEFAAVTDHGYGLPVAHGVSMARLDGQHREIDGLNEVHAGRFRLIKGIEANIRPDGTIDMTPSELRRLEIVVAAPHGALQSQADQTARFVAAVRAPGVHILGHPRGRKRGVRPGVRVDWDRVFEAAALTTVAIEIDGDPRRQDIDHVLARRALDAGCLFALDSDAHATDEWAFADIAVAHARLAGIPCERIINCWPLDVLLEWAAGLRA